MSETARIVEAASLRREQVLEKIESCLNFTDAARETLPGIAGAVQVCWMSRRRIAGFAAESGGNETADRGKLWFARLLSGDLMIPVRMEFASEFGSFTAELAELRGRGADLRLSE